MQTFIFAVERKLISKQSTVLASHRTMKHCQHRFYYFHFVTALRKAFPQSVTRNILQVPMTVSCPGHWLGIKELNYMFLLFLSA